ncbi:MAG: YihY family inner membrane protein, partial [gamma proteobacterium symbiont of Lucinoma myriamae]|nr:YihY family inner membrane protein [gamma proteobacterium symbiont of Lucinoma myriamae]MCU7819013.1 YihY family inner membrane protein [gamma proteobacterium symbiont of Lucinoma myriamae]MCU7832764.1 YihY family inner membrane protein [gamma proteobacterium symbiont of Lucinoma myriamae]
FITVSEPPIADPHDGWCGGCRRETCGYPIMTLFAFTLIYLIIPNTRVTFFHAFVGGITATLFFELAKRGFALYVSHNTTYTSLYGALATVPIFLIWIYISWLVTLLGAVTTRSMILFDFSLSQSSYSSHRFLSAFHILRVLSKASQNGQALTAEHFYKDSFLHDEKNVDEILSKLEELDWILKTENELWALAKDLDNVTLWDLYQKLPYSLPKLDTEEPLSSIIGQSNKVLAQELDFPIKTIFSRYD